MTKKKKVCCWDLEGPISVLDFAAEIGRLLSEKVLDLQKYDMGEFFTMISNYDDYLIDTPGIKERIGIPEYQPGDTLRLMAPLYVAYFSDRELIELARSNLGLLPGSKELMALLHKDWDVYVISTSYTQFAYNVTKELNIPQDHVYCTNLHIDELKKGLTDIGASIDVLVGSIFEKYLESDKNLDIVIDDINKYFWKRENSESDYIKVMNQVKVRGGRRKELAVEDISNRTDVPIIDMIALGDSITDINMLQRLKDEGGIAVSFNGNRFSLKRANVAVTTPNNLGALPIFENKNKINNFLEEWEKTYPSFSDDPKKIPEDLISKECKSHFIYYEFVPFIADLKDKSKSELENIISSQELMRKEVRGWAGNLG
ncbi:MAG: HAD hydrolase family protein [Candidatus Lokiarchaeota archaeon]|nr:HAD hydrolase family protein [Candidatus Lokiarchaeota archaeon]MBD3337905.1 HAD hydrolase family protein [Candidatus Lokiarchaeota archaeon]